jgi:hypothetical protein
VGDLSIDQSCLGCPTGRLDALGDEAIGSGETLLILIVQLDLAQAPLRANMATALGFEIALTSAQLNAIYAGFASGQPSAATVALLEKGGMSQT